MKIIEEILATLDPAPAVREACIGPFDTAVLSARWGISTTFRDDCASGRPAGVRGAGELVGRGALEIARLALSDRLLEASLGMAAINSLLDPGRLDLREVNASRLIAEKGRGKNVAVVGCFPFLDSVRGVAKNLWVVSRPPGEGAEGVKEAERVLPRADVVAITASFFINHTAADLLALCPRAYTVVLGPTTPLSPVLFRHGADALCGAVVADPAAARAGVREGAPFRFLAGVRRVTALAENAEAAP